ncbi:MAG: hypothetical protein Q3990_07375 [Desulfovibrionaceae bacterium]|nr:hypothetical protein [Desulfovibrionaceae bacterium]
MDTVLYRAVRKALKNMPMDEEEQHVFEQWKSDSQPAKGKECNGGKSKESSMVQTIRDILDGKYDNDMDGIGRLLDVAAEEIDKPNHAPWWDDIVNWAADQLAELLCTQSKDHGKTHKKMALTLKEKRFYQKQATASLALLNKEGLTFKETIAAQDQLSEALEKLRDDKAEKSLYQRLVDGEFYKLHWEEFARMCDRITKEENVPWTELHKYILAYVDENEPEGGYNYAAIMKPQESNVDTELCRVVRKALKNMPLDESERHLFEQWQASDSQTGR